MSDNSEKRIPGIRSPFYPLLILMLAVLVWFGFQISHGFGVRAQLKEQYANQETVMQNAEKMRSQLDGIATDTAKLAHAGNPNARIIIDELNKRGITVRTQ
jgi:hypothetical protein